jgi:hypothetical protein
MPRQTAASSAPSGSSKTGNAGRCTAAGLRFSLECAPGHAGAAGCGNIDRNRGSCLRGWQQHHPDPWDLCIHRVGNASRDYQQSDADGEHDCQRYSAAWYFHESTFRQSLIGVNKRHHVLLIGVERSTPRRGRLLVRATVFLAKRHNAEVIWAKIIEDAVTAEKSTEGTSHWRKFILFSPAMDKPTILIWRIAPNCQKLVIWFGPN